MVVQKRRLDVLLVERGLAESARAGAGARDGRARPRPLEARRAGRRGRRARGRARRRRTSRAPGTSSRTRSTRSGRRDRASTASTSAPRPAGSPTCCSSAARARVIALDVGYGQLHPRLRDDPRVTVLERTTRARSPSFPFAPQLVDLRRLVHRRAKALPPALRLGAPGWQALVLVKPQFEAGARRAPKGVVRDPAVRRRVLREVAAAAVGGRRASAGVVDSGLPGPKGNHEFVLHLVHARPAPEPPPSSTAGSTMPSVERVGRHARSHDHGANRPRDRVRRDRAARARSRPRRERRAASTMRRRRSGPTSRSCSAATARCSAR